jgi:4-oxalocrotonate tautomerase
MPTINVQLFAGRTHEQKKQFVEAVTRVTCETLNCTPSSVDIILTDVTKENWASEGILWSDKK